MDDVRLAVITDDVQAAMVWAANNRAAWGSWALVLTPKQLAAVPTGTPYVLISRVGATFDEFREMIETRGLREGSAADLRHPSFA